MIATPYPVCRMKRILLSVPGATNQNEKGPEAPHFTCSYHAACLLPYSYSMGRIAMKTNLWTKKIGVAVLGLLMILGIGLAFSTTAQAQWRTESAQERRQ